MNIAEAGKIREEKINNMLEENKNNTFVANMPITILVCIATLLFALVFDYIMV